MTVLYFAALICMMMQTVPTVASDRVIPVNQLPAAAKTFVQKTFPNLKKSICNLAAENHYSTYNS